jgi:hypothetical protein
MTDMGMTTAPQRDRVHHARMDDAHQLTPRLLDEQDHAHHLDAATGGTGARHEGAQEQQHTPAQKRGPQRIVGGRIPVVVATETT